MERKINQVQPSLTVFTPTYNRAYILHSCYESLKRQTSKEFVWLIIDDGSIDRTKEMVEGWISEKVISIRYFYQENQGMHGAHNTAYELIDTELNVCIDSDDYMPVDAVEKILAFWKIHGGEQFAGIIGLDASPDGELIGTKLPGEYKSETLSRLHAIHKIKGDKKLVYRTDIVKKIPPYPLFEGETYCPLSYKYILIDQEKPLLLLNEILCHVEYLTDGSSKNIIRQYLQNPNGFSFFRKTAMKFAPTFREKFREAAHYVSCSLLLKNSKYLMDSPKKWITVLATPAGFMIYFYIRNTKRATVMK